MSELTFRKFIKLETVDEEKREVGGIVTAEIVDKEGEICHYESTVPYYEAWSQELSQASDGQNLGNLREMHQLSAVGVGKVLTFDDAGKRINMTFKVVDDVAWNKVKEGVYTGFSQGGAYVKRWMTADGKKFYTARPTEVSLVDNPCLEAAHFAFKRADGTVEMRKFATATKETSMEGDLKNVQAIAEAVVKLLKQNEKPTTRSPEQLKQVKAWATKKANAVFLKRALEKGFQVLDGGKITKASLAKGMYEVGCFADLLSELAYLRMMAEYEREFEGDGSDLPEKLQAELESLVTVFLDMAEEESRELTETANKAEKEGDSMKTDNAASAAAELNKNKPPVDDHDADDAEKRKAAAEKAAASKKAIVDGLNQAIKALQQIGKSVVEDFDTVPGQVGDVEMFDPKSKATPNISTEAHDSTKAAKAVKDLEEKVYTKAEIDDMLSKNSDSTAQALIKTLIAAGLLQTVEEQPAANMTKAAPGIGDRTDAQPKKGTQLRVVPVSKADDASVTPVQKNSDDGKVDISKALSGSVEDALKLMRGAKAQTEVPLTLAAALSGRKSGVA